MEEGQKISSLVRYLPDKSQVVSEKGSLALIRCPVSDADQWKQWLNAYSSKTKTQWIVLTTKAHPGKSVFSRDYVCQHSAYNKGNKSTRNHNCLAKLSIRIKRNSKHTRFRDPYVKRGLLGVIKLRHFHSHATNTAQSLSALRPTPGTRKIFEDYFSQNLTPAAARHAHIAHLEMIEDDHLERKLADATVNPKRRTIHHWHDQWRLKYPDARIGQDIFEVLQQRAVIYNAEKSVVSVTQEPFAICILTPVMQCAHGLSAADKTVFVDSTASCNAENNTLTFLMTACPAGAVPLAVLITRGQDQEDYDTAFALLKASAGNRLFGMKSHPCVFLTDDCASLTAAIRLAWPASECRLRRYHVLRASWAWLWDDSNGVHRNDRRMLMRELQKLDSAATNEAAADAYDAAIRSPTAQRYLCWQTRTRQLWATKERWCQTYQWSNQTGPRYVHHNCEVAIRIFREIILNRCKAFNAVVLLDFVCRSLEGYYVRRLRAFATSQDPSPSLFLQVELKRCAYLIGREQVTRNAEGTYQVPSETNRAVLYEVEPTVGVCTCPLGQGGRLCKHQVALYKLFEEFLFTEKKVATVADRQEVLRLVGGHQQYPFFGLPALPSVVPNSAIENGTSVISPNDDQSSKPDILKECSSDCMMEEVIRLQRRLHEMFGCSRKQLEHFRRRLEGICSQEDWNSFLRESKGRRRTTVNRVTKKCTDLIACSVKRGASSPIGSRSNCIMPNFNSELLNVRSDSETSSGDTKIVSS